MLKRRKFLLFSSLLSFSPYLAAKEITSFEKEFEQVKETIDATQTHMFPRGSKLPSAKAMGLTTFLFNTISHHSYDKDIRSFVIEGAKELDKSVKGKFTHMSTKEKEAALRAFEESNYGSAWLSRILTLSIEGLFSDPIYGSNINESGWKALASYGGFPRPKTRYLS